jgi:hypothetical protein
MTMSMKQQFRLGTALAAALLAGTAGGAPQTRAETRTDMPSKPNPGAKALGTIEITAGCVGMVGDWEVGVGDVTDTGSVKKVALATWSDPAGVAAGYNMYVFEHALVPFGDGLRRILWIVPDTQKHRGRVGISPVLRQQPPSVPGHVSVYIVADDGWLRVNGPDIEKATDIRVTAWNTGQSPASVEVQWLSAEYAVQDTNPKNIHYTHLKVGSSLNIDGQVLTVRAIEPKTAEHPAWVRFEMAKTK